MRADFARFYPSEPALPTIWREGDGLRWRDVDSLLWNLPHEAAFWGSFRRSSAEARGEELPVTPDDVDPLEAMRWTDLHHLMADVRDDFRWYLWAKGSEPGDRAPEREPRPGMQSAKVEQEWRYDFNSDVARAARELLLEG